MNEDKKMMKIFEIIKNRKEILILLIIFLIFIGIILFLYFVDIS